MDGAREIESSHEALALRARPRVTILTPCYNEVDNVAALAEAVAAVMAECPAFEYGHLFIDNGSTDGTRDALRALAARDPHVQAIFNTRNFGAIRSSYHGLMAAPGDAVITMAADFQDPPELIPDLLRQWQGGKKIVIAVKSASDEGTLMYRLRHVYYRTLSKLSETELVENFTGYGLYDRVVVESLRKFDEPYPYFRGLICETGYERGVVEFHQPVRRAGASKVNIYALYNIAILGITNHSRVPLRLATFMGFLFAGINFLVGMAYLIYKLIAWQDFTVGMAPVVIGLFFFASVQLAFIGLIGEYVGTILTQVQRRPLVIEAERLNFAEPALQPNAQSQRT